jgi:tetratricopeptide (TPR) repeat protein
MSHLDDAEIALAKGRFRAAIDLFHLAMNETGANRPRSLQGLAYCHYKLGEFEPAEAYSEEALDQDARLPLPRITLAYLLMRRQQFAQALDAAQIALANGPDLFEANLCMGIALLFDHSDEKAVHYLKRAADIDSRDALVNQNLALAYDRIGEKREYLAELRKALRVQPTVLNALMFIGAATEAHPAIAAGLAISAFLAPVLLDSPWLMLLPLLVLCVAAAMSITLVSRGHWKKGIVLALYGISMLILVVISRALMRMRG